MADRFDEIAKEFWEDMGSDDGGAGISNLAERIRGLCEANPPKDPDRDRAQIVKVFMELWANSLHVAGVPRE